MSQEIDDETFDEISRLSEEGNDLLDEKGDWKGAIEVWKKALELVPEPKEEFEASTWLFASIGEAWRTGEDAVSALAAFEEAFRCPDGPENPFIRLGLGKCLYDVGRKESAMEHLAEAYRLEGEEIFAEGDELYLEALKEHAELE